MDKQLEEFLKFDNGSALFLGANFPPGTVIQSRRPDRSIALAIVMGHSWRPGIMRIIVNLLVDDKPDGIDRELIVDKGRDTVFTF